MGGAAHIAGTAGAACAVSTQVDAAASLATSTTASTTTTTNTTTAAAAVPKRGSSGQQHALQHDAHRVALPAALHAHRDEAERLVRVEVHAAVAAARYGGGVKDVHAAAAVALRAALARQQAPQQAALGQVPRRLRAQQGEAAYARVLLGGDARAVAVEVRRQRRAGKCRRKLQGGGSRRAALPRRTRGCSGVGGRCRGHS